MNTNQKLAVILLLIGAAIAALAQEPYAPGLSASLKSSAELGWSKSAEETPKPKTLTDAEQKTWQQFTQVEAGLQQAYSQAENALLNSAAGDGCESVKLHANFQEAGLRLSLIRARREAFLWKLRAEKSCADCVVSADGKGFEKPKAK